jgi:hypothetical protein
MSELIDFVLNSFRQMDAIVEPPAYGVYEVLLPETAAQRWRVPAFMRLTAADAPPETTGEVVRLGYSHPLVETLAEELRDRLSCTIAHINNVRLDKRGLVQLARQSVGLPNARIAEVPRQVEHAALSHYVVFNFKVALITDEKREQLVPVMMNLQAGHAVADRADLETLMLLEGESAFGELSPAPTRWIKARAADGPLAEPVLSALLERASRAALDEMAAPLQSLQRRAMRHLELDRARLTEYYDGLAGDLRRRLDRTDDDERLASLETKLAAVESERQAKLADVEAKYRLRIEMTLVNLMVVTQPKVLLPVQIGDRHTQIERTVVWDPLLHQLEPLVCDACGRPGDRLFLCAGGHLAHEECLLAEQCVDCKRVYCRLCADQLSQCVVCDRAVCRRSLNRCDECKRSTCREHVGLCHAADGEPVRMLEPEIAPPAEPLAPPEKLPPQPPPEKQRLSSARRQAAERARRQAQQQRKEAREGVIGQRIEAYIHPEAPLVEAQVLDRGGEKIAVRTWELLNEGIAVWCRCEKGKACRVNGKLYEPARAGEITNQIKRLAEELAQEYNVAARRIEWRAVSWGEMRRQPGPMLWGDWRNEERLALARVGYYVVYARQFPWVAGEIELPTFARQLEVDEAIEVGHVGRLAEGLLHFEGVLPRNELLARIVALARPGAWYTPQRGVATLTANLSIRSLSGGKLVGLKDTARPATLMKQKLALGLAPRDFTRLELLDAADPDAPPAKDLAQVERKLSQIAGGQEVNLRHLQVIIKNQPSIEAVLDELAEQYQMPEEQAEEWLQWLTRLWEQTPRYELGGRTPVEAQSLSEGQVKTKHTKREK